MRYLLTETEYKNLIDVMGNNQTNTRRWTMKEKISDIQKKFESIICICAEGVEFSTITELAKIIEVEAAKGHELCRNLKKDIDK